MTDRNSEHDRAPHPKPERPRRKRYTTPRLEEYGHVAKLTQGGGATRNEPNNPSRRMG